MREVIKADANPEKRLFISLITRDISLIAAFLDLIDNSINAAVEPFSDRLRTARDYASLLSDEAVQPSVSIDISLGSEKVTIRDTAGGISLATARDHVFKFGRSEAEESVGDRLSVYGIGLKRAIFKIGNDISIHSDHSVGGFDLSLDVRKWERIHAQPWTFDLRKREVVPSNKTGTTVTIAKLYDDVKRRLGDGVFEGELRRAISRTYSYFLTKFVKINVNGNPVEPNHIGVGDNVANDDMTLGDVTCVITAGIATPDGGMFRASSAGWFIYCNGRGIIEADKSLLTGWGLQLPTFQPKHRPFLGTAFFVSEKADHLPWTTTKASINEDSLVWQQAKRKMADVGRAVIAFLDSRYTDEGTEIASADVQSAAGARTNVVTASVAQKRTFTPPPRPAASTVKVQYDAKINDIRLIADFLSQPSMGAADVGRHTFHYFLRNQVGER